MEFQQMIEMLDEQNDYFTEVYPRYKAVLEARERRPDAVDGSLAAAHSLTSAGSAVASESAAARASVGSPSTANRSGSLTGMLSGLQALRASQAGSALSKATPESSGDPALFRTPLMTPGQVWDSLKATEGGRADAFLARLPLFSYEGGAKGNNTLVVRGEYFEMKGTDRVWAVVNLGNPLPGQDPATSLQKEVLVQMGFRVDPAKAASAGPSGAARYKWVQASRVNGHWAPLHKKERNLNPPNWPFVPGKPFFLRMILDPRGAFSYIDGKFSSYTRYPPSNVPKEGDTLVVQVPIAGDSGEKPTWRVTGMWWGSARVEAQVLNEVAATLQAAPQTVQQVVPDEIRITGLRPEAEVSDVLEAFKQYHPVDARMEGTGAAILRLPTSDANAVAAIIAETDRKIMVLGALLNVGKSMRTVTLGGGGAGGMRPGGPGSAYGGAGGGAGGMGMGSGALTHASASSGGSGVGHSISPYGAASGTPL